MLWPCGPPRGAQRYAHFVRVAALPVSHKMCIALVAPVAGVSAMNTLQLHQEEFEAGIVTELGFAAIDDAEGYGAASSIGAGSVFIAKLWEAFTAGKALTLHSKEKSIIQPKTERELANWCEYNFPACFGEYLRRATH